MIASRPAGKKVAALTPEQSAQQRAKQIVSNMFGESNERVLASMGWFFRKVWRRIYRGVHVALENLGEVQALARKGPLIFIPTHRSYVDFLVVSYIALVMNLPIPFIAAGEDFLGIFFVRWLFRNSGAFFIRRTFAADKLYSAILQKYAELLLAQGQSLEFFIEGTRSRTGKMLHPKMGYVYPPSQPSVLSPALSCPSFLRHRASRRGRAEHGGARMGRESVCVNEENTFAVF